MGEQIDVSELRNILSDCEAKVDNAVAEINRLKCIIDHIRGVLAGDADGTIFVIRTSRGNLLTLLFRMTWVKYDQIDWFSK